MATRYPGDSMTHASPTIDYWHHKIHEGNFFYYNELLTAMTTTKEYTIHTANTPNKWTHFVYLVGSNAECNIKIYEGATVSSAGEQCTVLNRNRNCDNVSDTLIYGAPVITANGTLIDEHQLGNDGVGIFNDVGGSSSEDHELILKYNTIYYILITAAAQVSCDINVKFNWYEQENSVYYEND